MTDWAQLALGGMPQAHPAALDGVWAKIERAAFHSADLQRLADEFIAARPYHIVESVVGQQKRIRAEATTPPPHQLALVLGDLIQNLRAALDHLAWAFALTTTVDPRRETAFPILRSAPKDFDALPPVADVPSSVRSIMHAMQPYQSKEDARGWLGRNLGTLRDLSNTDKHRLLLLTQRLVLPQYVSHNTPKGEDSKVEFLIDPWRRWAEIRHPMQEGLTYDPHFEAQVTLVDPELPWQSGLQGIAASLCRQTESVITAFRGEWGLLT